MKTRKVLDINHCGIWFICIYDSMAYGNGKNPYTLYRKFYSGNSYHRKKLYSFKTLSETIDFINERAKNNVWSH